VIAELNPTFAFRVWWRWRPGAPLSYYQGLTNKVNEIKQVTNTTLCGAVHLIALWRKDWDDYLQQWIEYPKTWEMALDPQKWGIPISKEDYQNDYAKKHGFHPGEVYQGDPSNPDYQQHIYHMAKRQIECGVDTIWIDFLWQPAKDMAYITKDPNHPAVANLMKGSQTIVDLIRKQGVKVGSWYTKLPYEQNLDFVTIWAATPEEILNKEISRERIKKEIANVKERIGDVPIYAFIDWGGAAPPMYAFSQQLFPEEQSEFLKYMDGFYKDFPEITLLYPVHGGSMGSITKPPRVLSYGRFDVYDSMAPEFQTYETIKELALAKKIQARNLSDVRIASQYRRITDGKVINRSIDDVIKILKETHTEFIFQGWMRENPCPETCSDLPSNQQKNVS
jgi:hypothetical protein